MSHLLVDLALSRADVSRAAQLRNSQDWLAVDQARVLVLNENKLPVRVDQSLHWISAHEIAPEVLANAILLGQESELIFVAVFDHDLPDTDLAWTSLREVGAALSSFDVGLATAATALSVWHRTHQFCNKCGSSTKISQAGWARRCLANDHEIFPRTEPAVIVAVEDAAGRILLGRRIEWAPEWFSTLAGFVEAGESAETTVVREVAEESGVLVDPTSIRYLGSQPWPFPASLMLGYRALALTTDLAADPDEMAEVRWFSRAQLAEACASGELSLPSNVSVAWRLIEDWYGEDLPLAWSRQPQQRVN